MITVNPIRHKDCFQLVSDFYGDKTADRSGVPLIRHIVEGICIMQCRGAARIAQDAFCLHPMFQTDEALKANWRLTKNINPVAVALTMEYRSVANAGLRTPRETRVIQPSVLDAVNEMLIADKIQNRKDFEKHNADHPEADDLAEYFKEWLSVLGISEHEYQRLSTLADMAR